MSAPAPSWEAVVTGIRWTLWDGEERWHLRLEWADQQPRVAGLEVLHDLTPIVRLGATVLLTSSWRGPVLDRAGMTSTPWAPVRPGKATYLRPDAGLRHPGDTLPRRPLARWRAVRAQIAGIDLEGAPRRPGVGLDLVGLDGASGQRWQVVARVPAHLMWFVELGAPVTLHVDPLEGPVHNDHRIDWVALGTERSGGGWTWRDVAPPGSLAAMLGPPR